MLQSRLASWVLASGNGPSPTILSGTTVVGLAVVSLALLVIFLVLGLHRKATGSAATEKHVDDGSPPQLLWPTGKIIQAYFERQFDFFPEGFKATSSAIFQFKLFRSNVIAISGEEARRSFFREKGLNLYEGFQVLIGTIPTGLDPQQLNSIYKRLSVIQKPDNLQSLIPQLLADCRRKTDLWGSQGTLDPCSGIHEVTFQMIIRSVSSTEIADDSALVCRMKRLYDIIDGSFRPFSLRFPSLPGPGTFQKLWASKTIYSIFKRAVDERKSSGVRKQDVLQQLLDAGEGTMCIVGFMMGLPIAGARSTGTIGTWLVLFLSSEQYWMSAVRQEIHTLLSTYAPSLSSSGPLSGQALLDALSSIPLSAWEYQMPMLDLCIRETLRAAQPHTAVRKNMGPPFTIGPHTIPSHAYVAYPFADTFLNPTYYADPTRWDPSRSLQHEETFLGWGGGKHMCKGQRLATLTLKLVTAHALTRYDLDVVDASGKPMERPPTPDWNDFLTCRPKEKCRIRFVERPCVVASS